MYTKNKKTGNYEFSLGCKYADGSISYFSPAKRNAPVKPPWDPPVTCQYLVLKRNDMSVDAFRFTSPTGVSRDFSISLLNNLLAGENAFNRKCTGMKTEKNYDLLAMYMTLLAHSKGFSYYRGKDVHNDLGIRVDGKGITEKDLQEKHGSIVGFREFKEMAEKAAFKISSSKNEAISKIVEVNRNTVKRKDQVDESPSRGVKVKVTKYEAKLNCQNAELERKGGIEDNFVKSYVGRADVPLQNLSISPIVCPKSNKFKVLGIVQEMKRRFDPTKLSMTVAPAEPLLFNKEKLEDNKYVVVSGSHTLLALQNLDEKGEMRSLISLVNGLISCFVIDTQSPGLLCYGKIRSNDVEYQYARKTQPEDLLFVYSTLKSQIKSEKEALTTVVNYAILTAIGADEITAIKKICSMEHEDMHNILEVIELYTMYQTADAKSHGNQARMMRGDPLPIRNSLFKRLAKVDGSFFSKNCQSIKCGTISLNDFVSNYEDQIALKQVESDVLHLTSMKNIEDLRLLYPRTFTPDKLEQFKGAVIVGPKTNQIGKMLTEYCKSASSSLVDGRIQSEHISFESTATLPDCASLSDSQMIIVSLKNDESEYVIRLVDVLFCTSSLNSLLVLFGSEQEYWQALSYVKNLQQKCLVTSIFFGCTAKNTSSQVIENVRLGLLVCTKLLSAPVSMYYPDESCLKEVVSKVCVPGSRICFVSESDLVIPCVHDVDNLCWSVKYFASAQALTNLKKVLKKVTIDSCYVPAINGNTKPTVADKNTAGTPIGKLKFAPTAPGVCTTIKNFKVDSKELSHEGNTNVYEFKEEGSNNNIMEDEVVNDPNLVVSTLDLAATLM